MITAIIQARMGSRRFPGKIFSKIKNKSLISYVIRQTLSSKSIKNVIIATTNLEQDNTIVNFCKRNNLDYFRGSTNDVLDRYYQCAKKFRCDPVVRISSDSPLIDPTVIDQVVRKFQKNSYDYVSNNVCKIKRKWQNSSCNFPIGTVVEICSFNCLEKAWKSATKPSEREHVFPYVQFNSKKFKISNIQHEDDLSYIRTTVDKKQDLTFVKEIFERIPTTKKFIVTKDIVKIVNKEPQLLKINNFTSFDEGFKKSLAKDHKKGFS